MPGLKTVIFVGWRGKGLLSGLTLCDRGRTWPVEPGRQGLLETVSRLTDGGGREKQTGAVDRPRRKELAGYQLAVAALALARFW